MARARALFAAANSKVAVEQIAASVRDHDLLMTTWRSRTAGGGRHPAPASPHRREAAEQPRDDVITAEYLTACVRRLLDGEDAMC